MSWFNVLKGAYPSLQQIDKTLNVASGQTGIVRGSCLYQVGTEFLLAGAAQATDEKAYILFALMAQDDLVAGMAGGIGQGVTPGATVPAGYPALAGTARITGLACGMPFEFETDQYAAASYTVGQLLSVGASGKLVAHGSGDNVIAQVTKAVTTRWVNSAVAVTGWRTGANVNVLTARSLWIPTLTV